MAVWFKVLRVRIGVCRSTNNELFWIIWKKRIDFPWKFVLPMLSMFLFPYFMSNKSFTWNGRWRWHVLVGCHDLSWAWLKLHTQCTKKNGLLLRTIPGKFTKKCGMWPWWKITPQLMWSYSYVWIGWVIQWWEDSSVRPSKWTLRHWTMDRTGELKLQVRLVKHTLVALVLFGSTVLALGAEEFGSHLKK